MTPLATPVPICENPTMTEITILPPGKAQGYSGQVTDEAMNSEEYQASKPNMGRDKRSKVKSGTNRSAHFSKASEIGK